MNTILNTLTAFAIVAILCAAVLLTQHELAIQHPKIDCPNGNWVSLAHPDTHTSYTDIAKACQIDTYLEDDLKKQCPNGYSIWFDTATSTKGIAECEVFGIGYTLQH